MDGSQSQASLEFLLRTLRDLTSSLDLKTVLEGVLRIATIRAGAERGMLVVLDQHQHTLLGAVLLDGRLVESTAEDLQLILERGLAGRVLRERSPALVANTSLDARWLHRRDDDLDRTGAKSAVCVPLTTGNEVEGVLTLVHSRPEAFTQQHLEFIRAITEQASIAVRNARLYHALDQAARRYRELFEGNMDPIIITDRLGNILEANRRAALVWGYPVEILVTQSIFALHSGPPDILDQDTSRLDGLPLVTYEAVLLTHDRRRIPVKVTIRKLDTGGEEQLQWIFYDVRERKELDSLRRDLAAMTYHDLRSPLANIANSLDMLKEMLPPETAAQAGPVLGITGRSIARLQRLIDSLVDIDRLEAGQPVTHCKEAGFEHLLREALDAVQSGLEGKGQRVALQVSGPLPEVWVDAEMIRRVIINLLENASKYSPVRSLVEVDARIEGGSVRLSVKDCGPGIPPEWREAVFEKYTRIQSEQFPGGLGLGLAFCRLAVEAHGGRIWVESQPAGGSQFIFILPLTRSESSGSVH